MKLKALKSWMKGRGPKALRHINIRCKPLRKGAVFIAFMVGSMAGGRCTFSCILLYFLIIAKKKNSSEIVSFQRSFGGEAGI